MNRNLRPIAITIGFLIILMLAASIFQDILTIIFRDNISNFVRKTIIFVLIFMLIQIMLKIHPFKELDNLLKKCQTKK